MGVGATRVVDYNTDHEIEYMFRIDQKPAVKGTANVAKTGNMFFIRGNDVTVIFKALVNRSVVRLRWPEYNATPALIEVPSEGLRPILAQMSCIAPLLPPERAPAPAVSSPPAQPRTGEGSGR